MTTLDRLATAFGTTADAFWESAAIAGDPPALVVEGGEIVEIHIDRLFPSYFPVQPTELAFEDCPALVRLSVPGLGLKRLAVRRAPRLVELACDHNALEVLELEDLPALEELQASDNALPELGVTHLPALRRLYAGSNRLARLDVPPDVESLHVAKNALTTLEVPPHVRDLDVPHNALTRLDVPASVRRLWCLGNPLADLDVGAARGLAWLYASDCHLAQLALDDHPALLHLDVSRNTLRRLDLRATPALETLGCADNVLDALDLTAVPRLRRLVCPGNPLTTLALPPGLLLLGCERTPLTRVDLTVAPGLAEATLPPEAEIAATSLQRARIPALRKRFGLRKMPSRVADMDLYELHLVAERQNWDTGMGKLRQVAASPALDRGTALMLYWRAHPEFYLDWVKRSEVPTHARAGWDLVQALEKRLLADEFATRTIPFDPKSDTCHPSTGTDWTQGAQPRVRAIPPSLFAPCSAGA